MVEETLKGAIMALVHSEPSNGNPRPSIGLARVIVKKLVEAGVVR